MEWGYKNFMRRSLKLFISSAVTVVFCVALMSSSLSREQSVKPKAKPDLSNGGYGDENVKTNVNVNVVLNNPLRVDAKPFFSSKLINNKEKLKRTRLSSQTMGMLSFGGCDEGETNTKEKKAIESGLPDSKEFKEVVIMAVFGDRDESVGQEEAQGFSGTHCPP
ncbi:hypothetical protein HID58_044841 [Brassica napus]|uniref:Hexosyltransferase n=2 Tax=Brassica napus TaxID=3708 RepID=A0ABQ7XFN5_BRANA|nr:hypothetical protein HID58_044841 [Brassica napus]